MKIQDSLKKGTVEMLVLFMLQEEEKYGYQIRQELKVRSEGYYQLPDASLYPTLYRLMQNDYISEREEIVGRRLRRYYRLEPKGRERLATTLAEYGKMQAAVEKVLATGKKAADEEK